MDAGFTITSEDLREDHSAEELAAMNVPHVHMLRKVLLTGSEEDQISVYGTKAIMHQMPQAQDARGSEPLLGERTE